MIGKASSWIPQSRIRVAIGIALALTLLALAGSFWSPAGLVLLVPALGAAWAAFLMLRISHQLSPQGAGWEGRIHEAVATRLALTQTSRPALLDIGCGDASLLISLLQGSPGIEATGIDWWGAGWSYRQTACEARLSALGLHAAFHRMDAGALDFPDQSFDIVVSVMCFHEVRAAPGAAISGPLTALSEALRVLRPGGLFVLIDRFGAKADYSDPATLEAIFQATTDLRREPLVPVLGVPWPLSTQRALGPVEMLSGRYCQAKCTGQ